jgi:hypothetical protein
MSIKHIIKGQGIGNWDKFNKRYPQLQIQKPSPTEQILSQGITQIVSTSRSQPLTPEGPTGTLSTIIQNITQLQTLPTFLALTMTQPGTMVQTTNIAEGGALYRAPPPIFRGDSQEAD